ncbi:MAG: aldolase/citrate lyase family protein [Devosia sp.]|nr:aldolase/citrate lyase family protein [Devosia sp.]
MLQPTDSLRLRLKTGAPFIVTFSIIAAVEIVELVALAGFDGIILDMEHGAYGTESLGPLVLAARARGIYPLVRVRTGEPSEIGAALDAGAAGVIVPQIGSAEEARRAVRAARFAPDGNRGANPFVRGADYSGRAEWFAKANEDVAVLLMVEGADGVAALPEILTVPTLDGIFLGPMDLSHALGVPGEMGHPKVVQTIEAVIEAVGTAGLVAAIFAGTPDSARRWLGRGVTLVGVGVDTAHILVGLKGVAEAVRAK